MPVKIKRDLALIQFRNLPLQEYDESTETELVYYPKTYSCYWIKLENATSKHIATEFKKLIRLLAIEHLIVLGQINKPWISKRTKARKDFKPLCEAVQYFDQIGISGKFNGAVRVSLKEIKDFVTHFYVVTKCDAAFFDYHMMDAAGNLLFHIHYSGEIQILTLNETTIARLKSLIPETKFLDVDRAGTSKLLA